ncbi:MAG: hypothetical protein Q9183_003488 [Haloplaca sp. 2 TL-2023]
MGGLAVDVSHMHDRLTKIFLTPQGVIHLAERGYFFHVSDADIEDKSKADALAKALVLTQITWTVLQCLSRKVVGLPLCILEVHVLVHAGCALIMYMLWFKKPLKIEETLDVSSKIPDKVLALMLVQNYRYGSKPYGNFELMWEYRTARLQGSKAGPWPSRLGAEAQYLMYNPYLSGTSTPRDPSGIPVPAGTAQPQSPSVPAESLIDSETPGDVDRVSRLGVQPGPFVWGDSIPDPKNPQQGTAFGPGYVSAGFGIRPREEIKSVATITTGEFVKNGIGPKAFVTGPWIGDLFHPFGWNFQRPGKITQVSDALRKRLPLDQVDQSTVEHCSPLMISLSKKDLKRWELAGAALLDDNANQSPLPSHTIGDDTGAFLGIESSGGTLHGAYFATGLPLFNWGIHLFEGFASTTWRLPKRTHRDIKALQGIYQHLQEVEVLTLGPTTAIMMLPGLLYGALHLTLWAYTFPTTAERDLWRISSVTLVAVPFVLGSAIPLQVTFWKIIGARDKEPQGKVSDPDPESHCTKPVPNHAKNTMVNIAVSEIKRLGIDFAFFMLFLILLLYLFARVFIIVESFISLRHVPLGVYTEVGWSTYIPHL